MDLLLVNLQLTLKANLMKGKNRQNYRERGRQEKERIDSTDKKKHDDQISTKKGNNNNNTCRYCGKLGHLEKVCWQKTEDLEDKVKSLEGDVLT